MRSHFALTGKGAKLIFSRIIEGSALFLLGNLLRKGFKFAHQMVLAFLLGPYQYGLYALAETLFQITKKLAMMGFHHALLRFAPPLIQRKRLKQLGGLLRRAFLFPGLLSAAIAAVVLVLGESLSLTLFGDPNLSAVLKLLMMTLPFAVLIELIAFAHRSAKIPARDVLTRDVLGPGSLFVGAVIGYGYSGTVVGTAAGFLGGGFVSFVAAWLLYRTAVPFDQAPLTAGEGPSANIFSFASLTWLLAMATYLLARVDRLMIGYFMSGSHVGIYNIAALLGAQTAVFLHAGNAMFSSYIASLWKDGKTRELNAIYSALTRWLWIFSVPLPVLFFVYGSDLLALPGRGYVEGFWPLFVISCTYLVNAAVGASGYLLIMTSHHRMELSNTVALLALNVLLNVLFIPRFGILGAAVATGLSVALVNLCRLIEVRSMLSLWPYETSYFGILGVFVVYLPVVGLVAPRMPWYLGFPLLYGLFPVAGFWTSFSDADRQIWDRLRSRLPLRE